MSQSRFQAWRGILGRKGVAAGLGALTNSALAKAHGTFNIKTHIIPFRPANLIVGVVNVCNLQCIACMAHGYPEARERSARDPYKFMAVEQFARILDNGGVFAHSLDLTSPGEAFLHPHIYDMIEMAAHRYGITVKVDTNGHVLDPQATVASGLSRIVFAVDGFTQQNYATYRKGGDLATVVRNIELLSETALSAGSLLDINVKYLVNRFTEGEVEQAREHFSRLKNVRFFVEVFLPPAPSLEFCLRHPFETTIEIFEYWRSTDEANTLYYVDTQSLRCRHKCMQMPFVDICKNQMYGIYVLPDGECYPCCYAAGYKLPELRLGNAFEQSLSSVFNGKKANDVRRAYARYGGKFSLCRSCWGNRVFVQSEACRNKNKSRD